MFWRPKPQFRVGTLVQIEDPDPDLRYMLIKNRRYVQPVDMHGRKVYKTKIWVYDGVLLRLSEQSISFCTNRFCLAEPNIRSIPDVT